MTKPFKASFEMIIRAMFTCIVLLFAASAVEAQRCSITIDSPKPGENVGANGDVRGKASVPPSGHLWVLAHMAGLGVGAWWPQGQGPVNVTGADWEVTVYYGQESNKGRNFEVAAVVVGDEENQRLNRWVTEAPDRGYPGTRFPDTVQGCPITTVTVLKTQ